MQLTNATITKHPRNNESHPEYNNAAYVLYIHTYKCDTNDSDDTFPTASIGPSSLTFAHCRKQVTVLLDCPEKQVLTAVPKDGLGMELCNPFTLLEETSLSITQPVAIIVSCAACNAALAMLSVSTLKLVHLVSNSSVAGESISIPVCSLS